MEPSEISPLPFLSAEGYILTLVTWLHYLQSHFLCNPHHQVILPSELTSFGGAMSLLCAYSDSSSSSGSDNEGDETQQQTVVTTTVRRVAKIVTARTVG
jgi:hypothetical protein